MATSTKLACGTAVFFLLWLQVNAIKVAVVSNGDYTDFGWTYAANDGLRQMEKALKIHGCTLVANILADTAVPVIQGLIDDHYELIISISGVHTPAVYELAVLYPNVYFVIYGGSPNKNITNVSSLSFNMNQMNYIFGYLSALQSKTGKVGIITPVSNGTANAFYLGMQNANPAVELYHVMIDTYLDPDRSYGAASILLAQGVDTLSQQQDDLTVPVFAMNHSMLAHGTNGIRLAALFGENVATSVLRNWTTTFVTYVTMVMTGTWKQTSLPGTFKNGMLVLDSFSYLIPDEVVAQVLAEKDRLVNGTRNITSPTGSRLNPDIHYMGTYAVPLTQVSFPDSFVIGLAVTTSILLALALAAGIAVILLREDQHIWSSSPKFLVAILCGAALTYISVLLRLPTPTEGLCHGTIWTVAMGYSIMLAPLIVKNFRIWRIFDNPKLEERTVTNGTLFAMSTVIWLGCILLLAVWSGVGDVDIDETPGADNLGKYEYRTVCTQSWDGDSVWIAILAYHGVLLVVGCFISYKIRTVAYELFNESKSIALCIYNITFCLCVIIPIILAVPDQVARITLFCVAVLFCTSTTIGILFVPKFWGIIVEGYSVHPILATKQSSMHASTDATATGASKGGQP